MEAIILAGGYGTRLREIVSAVPKPMAPIRDKPFLELLLAHLSRQKFKKVIISIGYMGQIISDYFGDHFHGMRLSYVAEDAPLGTGGAIRLSMNKVTDDHVYIFNGDTFLDLEINLVESHWQINKKPILIAREVQDTYRYGRLILSGKNLVGFSEKDTAGSGLINAGCYIFNRCQLDSFDIGSTFSLEKDYLSITSNCILHDVFVTNGKFIDIGIPEDYIRAQSELSHFHA
jgi:D-glycero-alpha-D-manno-heptose 1-phosphate guanylyltransferase